MPTHTRTKEVSGVMVTNHTPRKYADHTKKTSFKNAVTWCIGFTPDISTYP
jgi:hypothetical protein